MNWRQWKASVDIETILSHAGALEGLHREGDRLFGPCPVHRGDNPRAFRVDCRRNLWYCFTRCGTGGDQLSLAWHLRGRSWPEVARWLASAQADASCQQIATPTPATKSEPSPRPFNIFTRCLPLDTRDTFFQQRGLSPQTLKRFDAGVWRGHGFLEGMAAVRLFDPQGRALGYAGRRLDPEAASRHGKWKWPPGFPKSSTLYNWHRAASQAQRGLLVVEGAWSVMKLAQAGFQNAVALGGTAVSDCQAALLGRASQIVLMLDGDQAGQQAMARHRQSRLHNRLQTVTLPNGADPADLPDQSLRELLSALFPWPAPDGNDT